MRIVAGTARGRRLAAPPGAGTRPTSDKVRQAIFNLLGQSFEGGAVLDLYAGSGAMALEALSRGCATALCLERDPAACGLIRENAEGCGLAGRLEVRCAAVEAALPRLPAEAFDLAFVDPPYAAGPGLALAGLGRVLAPGGVAVAEHDARRPPPEQVGALRRADQRRYGGTGISIYRRG